MSRVIAITGAAGYLGQHLIRYLFQFSSDIDHFVALDIREISPPSGILKGRGMRVPLRILKALLRVQWKLRLSRAPPAYLDFVAYPFVASNSKMKKLGYNPKYFTEEALLSLQEKEPLLFGLDMS